MIRVMIVEDSLLYRAVLKQMLTQDERIEVCAEAAGVQAAKEQLAQLRPDVLTLDMTLGDGTGQELLQWMQAHCPEVPVLVVTSQPRLSEEALALGARDFIEKVQDASPESREHFALLLRLKVKTQAMDVFRPGAAPPVPAAKAEAPEAPQPRPVPPQAERPAKAAPPRPLPDARELIVLGASLGGTEATLQVLRQLPPDAPGILVVQHMPQGFTHAYAMRLDACCALHCREAKGGDFVRRGDVLVAPGGSQMTVQKTSLGYRVRCIPEEKVPGRFCPSVDVLFHSAAEACGKDAVAVLLTGMGRDGAQGMKALHDAGAYTIGQDENTCAVYGMPQAARALGAVDAELPLDQIAGEILRRVRADSTNGGNTAWTRK